MAPSSQGLYNPAFEHDSCGVAMVVDMHGRRTRDIVDKAITALFNLEHRGAQGAEPHSGDGAGILLQVPDEFLRAVVEFDLPESGSYATGIAFLPQSSKDAATACEAVEKIVEAEGLEVLGWRAFPPTSRRLAPWPATRCRRSGSCSSRGRPAWIWSAARTSCASVPSTSWAPRDPARTDRVAKPSISQAFPARRSSTRAC